MPPPGISISIALYHQFFYKNRIMKITRVYAERTASRTSTRSRWRSRNSSLGEDFVFRHASPGAVNDWHRAPRRQYVINLCGESEIEIDDGTKRRFGPGDIFLVDDTTGRGTYLEGDR